MVTQRKINSQDTANACDSSNIHDKVQILIQNEDTPTKNNANLASVKNDGNAKENKQSNDEKLSNQKFSDVIEDSLNNWICGI